jgi:hypothetical protein
MQQPLENFSHCLHAAQSLADHPEPEIPAIKIVCVNSNRYLRVDSNGGRGIISCTPISSSSCISPDLHAFSSHFDAPISYRQHDLSTLETDAVHILGGFLGEFFSLHGQYTQLTLSSCQIASQLPPLTSLPQLKQAQKRPVSMSGTDPESNHQLGFCLQFGSNSLDHFTIHGLLLMDNTSSSHAPHIVSRSLLTDLQLPPVNPPAIADHRSCKKSRVIPRLVVGAKTRA